MSCYHKTQRLQRKERKMVGFVPGHTILDRLPISMCGIIHVEQPKPEAAFCAAGYVISELGFPYFFSAGSGDREVIG